MNPPTIAVVAGATGAVGEGIVLALLAHGWHVHALGRDAAKLDALSSRTPRLQQSQLRLHVQDFEDDASTSKTCETVLASSGKVDLVIASIGGWWQGPSLPHTTLADWRAVMRNNLDAHFLCVRQWWPVLQANPQSAYIMINGGAALSPAPLAGAVSVAASAQLMMKNALAADMQHAAPNTSPRVYSVLANTPVFTRNRTQGQANWLNTEDLTNACLICFEDHARMHHGQTLALSQKAEASKQNGDLPAHWY